MLELGSDGEIILAHQMIQQTLGVQCAVLSGANIARQIALEEHAETTIGCHSQEDAIIWKVKLTMLQINQKLCRQKLSQKPLI